MSTAQSLAALRDELDGELHDDHLLRTLYATDASVYRELPLAVAYPKTKDDIRRLLDYARRHRTSLIPRTAGTSLAGQCVGQGIVVDTSRHWNRILEVHAEERYAWVQPGVIRDELNAHLKPLGLFFGPNTSTANRCMIGGMVGNNSCGSTSIEYGSTRDHLLAISVVLSDGTEATFEALSDEAFRRKSAQSDLEGRLYRHIESVLSQPAVAEEIRQQYPKPDIRRRNTGYALDLLLACEPFTKGGPAFNFSRLLAGSEGTLALTTAVKLNLVPLPKPHAIVVAAHFGTLGECMEATVLAMRYRPNQCELMDKTVLDCTKGNIRQQRNRFFVQGDPAAVLMVEFRADTPEAAHDLAETMIHGLQAAGKGYAFPTITGDEIANVWELRSAGLGVLSNIPGDAKPVAVIEDTAVALEDLPAYIRDFEAVMEGFGQKAVYYAHAGAGEIHLRPVLDLKDPAGVRQFHDIALASAKLVKRYGGSLSGEHGDGRVRAAFIPLMLGDTVYGLLQDLKSAWDPDRLLNPGKVTDAPPMTESLRYTPGQPTPAYPTVFDFSAEGGILRAAEKCNGSGDCRRLDFSGGTMCPSYRATRAEKDTTRARANALREFLTHPPDGKSPFGMAELAEVMDLCLSCKGCTSECPSNVDMTTLKSEFLHQYYQIHGVPLRARFFGHIGRMNAVLSHIPQLSNLLIRHPWTAPLLKRLTGVAPSRNLPPLHSFTLRQWFRRHRNDWESPTPKRKVWFFCDEFTNYYDVEAGIKAIRLLRALGYSVQIPPHAQSGRAQLSKGLLPEARELARKNVRLLSGLVSAETPLVGLEPSALLSFRDEYPRLVPPAETDTARSLARHCLLVDEFLSEEIKAGHIRADRFSDAPRQVLLHGHCHQKALSSTEHSAWVAGLPRNYSVSVIPSGCCGMAGSFGYEAEHYEVSMKIGELVLLPAVRRAGPDVLVAATGTSCRHQIADGTGRKALHPVEILYDALLP